MSQVEGFDSMTDAVSASMARDLGLDEDQQMELYSKLEKLEGTQLFHELADAFYRLPRFLSGESERK